MAYAVRRSVRQVALIGTAGFRMNRRSYCTIRRSLTAVAVMALCPFLVRAGSLYAGIEGGVSWQSPQDQDIGNIQFDRLEFKTGWAAGLVAGYSFENGLRSELELDYRDNNFSHDLYGAAGGQDRAESQFVNLWHDFRIGPGPLGIVHPYLGGGLGAVEFNSGTGAFPDGNGTSNFDGVNLDSHHAMEFGYQAGVGVGIELTPNLTLSLDYRHLWTQRGGNFLPLPFPVRYDDRYVANTTLLSVRYSYSGHI
jgi:OmpA-OmpF porin, OOP family